MEALINIAPPPHRHYPFGTTNSQTILVTQYFQPSPTPGGRQTDNVDESDEDESDDGDSDTNNVCGYRQNRQEEEEREEDDDEADHVDAATVSDGGSLDQKIPARDDKEDENDDDDEEEEDDGNHSIGSNGIRPWPPEHSKFLDSPMIQEHLALEIASGGGTSQRPKDIQKGNVRIVIPGSLRERGEFCLVDMSLIDQVVMKSIATASTASSPTKMKKSWSVSNVEFHNMERLP